MKKDRPIWFITLPGAGQEGPYTTAEAREILNAEKHGQVVIGKEGGSSQTRVQWILQDRQQRVKQARQTDWLTSVGYGFTLLAVVAPLLFGGWLGAFAFAASGGTLVVSALLICTGRVLEEMRVQTEKLR